VAIAGAKGREGRKTGESDALRPELRTKLKQLVARWVAEELDSVEEALEGIREDLRAGDKVPMEASVWSVPLIVATPGVGKMGSAFLVLLLAFNVALQSLFLVVLISPGAGLTEPQIGPEELTSLRHWRLYVAHDFRYYNSGTQQSLASRYKIKVARWPRSPSLFAVHDTQRRGPMKSRALKSAFLVLL
jgi:hypothetical protein